MLKTAVAWGEIADMPCAITWVKVVKREARFHHPEAFSHLVDAALEFGTTEYLVALLGGEAGLRSGEMRALEWGDIDFANRNLCVSRSDWKGQVTAPKSGQPRYVAMTERLATALKDAQHTRSSRVMCDGDGNPFNRKVVWGMMRRVGLKAEPSAVFTFFGTPSVHGWQCRERPRGQSRR